MAGVGTLILAADFNNIQSKVAGILGSGSGQSGYGQTVLSAQVSVNDPIRASQWTALRSDIIKARQHQTGTDITGSITTIVAGATVVANSIEVEYMNFADTIIANKDVCAANQGSVENVLSPFTKTDAWNGTISNTVTISFSSYDHARYFFNAGGNLQLSSGRSGGSSSSKNNTWTQMLSDAGTITMNRGTTSTSGSGSAANIGFYGLTTSDQEIFNKPAPSGSYSPNFFRIYARTNGSNQVIVRFEFQDYDVGFYDASGNFRGDTTPAGYRQDENVDGNLSTTVQMFRPTGSNVEVSAPTASQTGM